LKIAIHKSSWGFSQDWIAYCERMEIDHKIVNCYDTDIVEKIADCDVLMWHHHHTGAKDALFARQLLFAVQQSGKKVFPDFNTSWHFDDKVGQKYLLEAIGAPMAPTWVFYEKQQALEWIKTASFPKVFKLRGGAGSTNVKLVRTKQQARQMINKAFGTGFPSYDKWGDLKEQIRKFKWRQSSFVALAKSIRRLFVSTRFARTLGPQKGYVLFQEFIPDNAFDIRVVTIGNRAFAIKRLVRPNDFRASGSGSILYDKEEIDERCVKIAFETTEKLKAQCVAYDFVFEKNNQPLIVEINYGYDHKAYFSCPGYWDRHLKWHQGSFNSAEWMVEELI
jgi:glutathione synthase/RimK-type ligase-like ATP-grasp enzyme